MCIRDSWSAVAGADAYRIARGVGDGPLAPYATVEGNQTTYTDNATVPGTTYRYRVSAVSAAGDESEGCGTVEATAIPFLPALWVALPLGALGAAAFIWQRRRGAARP